MKLSAIDEGGAPDAPHNSAASRPPAIAADGLRRSYGERLAVAGVSITVGAGEIVGLLGPNGAGKTTTLSMIAGVAPPDAGKVAIAGVDLALEPYRARRMLGYVPQSIALYPSLTAIENLNFFGRIQGLSARQAHERGIEMLREVGLGDRAQSRVEDFSGGMQRRLNIACGMIHSPAAILLDEPTVGVDPQSRNRIFDVVMRAAARGTAMLYSTHYMEEIERMCARAILIDGGRVVASGTIRELIAMGGAATRIELTTRAALRDGWCEGIGTAVSLDDGVSFGAALEVARLDQVPEVLRRVEASGAGLIEFRLHRPNLQDAFIKLTGHALRDNG